MMAPPGDALTSSFADTDATISKHNALPYFELPFGDKITIMDIDYVDDYHHVGGQMPCRPGIYQPAASPRSTADAHEVEEYLEDIDEDADVEDSDDLQPLQYARQHGLTSNYFERDPLQCAGMLSPPDSVAAEFGLTDPETGERARAKELIRKIENEPWDMDKETAELLTSAMALSRGEEDEVERRRVADLKIDEPVLRSDPEVDLWKLRSRNTVSISNKGIAACELGIQKGESLAWSAEDMELPVAIARCIKEEKPDLDRETAELLKDVISPEVLDQWEAIEMAIDAEKASL